MDKVIYAILSVKNDTEKLVEMLVSMKGVSDAGLFLVSVNEIAAVVSEFETNRNADRSDAIEYANVIETLSQKYTLLPVRFGSVMKSNEDIIRLLERNYQEIQHNFEKVDNKFEFGIKVFCDSEKIKDDLISKSEADTKKPEIPVSKNSNSIYREWVNEKLKVHRIEELMVTYIDSVIEEITTYLIRLKGISKFKKMVTATTVIDVVFLVDKTRKDELIQAVGNLQSQFLKLNFVLTGPWPPYNFVDFKVKYND
jgi:hypothetical protein